MYLHAVGNAKVIRRAEDSLDLTRKRPEIADSPGRVEGRRMGDALKCVQHNCPLADAMESGQDGQK